MRCLGLNQLSGAQPSTSGRSHHNCKTPFQQYCFATDPSRLSTSGGHVRVNRQAYGRAPSFALHSPRGPCISRRFPVTRAIQADGTAPPLADSPSRQLEGGGPPSPGPGPSGWTPKAVWKQILRRLSSLPLAIGELALIALLSAVGTIIEQNKPLEFYVENYPDQGRKVLGFLDYHIISALQLDNIYTANYFVGLLLLLGASLAACTATRQLPQARIARKWRFPTSSKSVYTLGSEDDSYMLPNADVRDLGRLLKDKAYQVFYRDGRLYAFKGFTGKIGPIFVHASMLLIMAGVGYGSFCGFKGQVMVPEGGDFVIGERLRAKSPLAIYPQGAYSQLHVNNFEVRYRDDGSVGQFFSDISVFDEEGRERVHKTISVNDPLRYKGVTAYQADYSMAAVTLRAEGSPLQPANGGLFNLPMASLEGQPGVQGKVWATYIPAEAPKGDGTKPRGVAVVARDFQLAVLYKADGSFAGVRRIGSGKPIEVEGLTITIEDVIGSTGLELKSDPGVPIVYAGFGGLMIATLVSYLSHSQIWALQEEGTMHVSGKSNRAIFDFSTELGEVLDKMPERVAGVAPTLPTLPAVASPAETDDTSATADVSA